MSTSSIAPPHPSDDPSTIVVEDCPVCELTDAISCPACNATGLLVIHVAPAASTTAAG